MQRSNRVAEQQELMAEANKSVTEAKALAEKNEYKEAYAKMVAALEVTEKRYNDELTAAGIRQLAWRDMELGRSSVIAGDYFRLQTPHMICARGDGGDEEYAKAVRLYKQAIAGLQKAHNTSPKTDEDSRWLATCYSQLAYVAEHTKKYTDRKNYCQSAINEIDNIPVENHAVDDTKLLQATRKSLLIATKDEYHAQHGCIATIKRYGFFGTTPKPEAPVAAKSSPALAPRK